MGAAVGLQVWYAYQQPNTVTDFLWAGGYLAQPVGAIMLLIGAVGDPVNSPHRLAVRIGRFLTGLVVVPLVTFTWLSIMIFPAVHWSVTTIVTVLVVIITASASLWELGRL